MTSLYVWIGQDINDAHYRGISLSRKDTPKHLTRIEIQKIAATTNTKTKALTWLKELLKLLETYALKEALLLLVESLDLFQACLSENIYNSLSQGRLLSQALQQWPMLFNKNVCDWIRIGEQCGSISSLGLQAIENSFKKSSLKKKIIRQLTYPAIIFICSIGLGVFILHTLIPSIQSIYLDMNQQLPPLLKAALSLKEHLFSIGLCIFLFLILTTLFLMCPTGKQTLQDLLSHTRHFQSHVMSSWLTLLSECLSASIPLQESLFYTKKSLPQAWHISFENLMTSLLSGKPLYEAISHFPSCSVFIRDSIRIAEHNHTLPSTLNNIASDLANTLHESRARCVALLQPTLMIIIGLFIAGLFVLMYQPIVKMGL